MVDLVEYIQNKAKMKMMNDVKEHVTEDQLKKWYSELEIEDYTIFQWNDALSYIKRDIKKFDSVEAVKKWIKSE